MYRRKLWYDDADVQPQLESQLWENVDASTNGLQLSDLF